MKEILDQNFGKDWIGRGGPLSWPPYSPDSNHFAFYLKDQIGFIVYQVPKASIEHIKSRMTEAIQSINENTLMRVWGNMKNCGITVLSLFDFWIKDLL